MKLNSKILGIIILVVIFGGIALSSALGYWNTETSGGGGYGGGGETETEAESIRGRTTFQDLLDLGLAQEVIEQAIGGPMPEPSTLVKVYCEANGLDFEIVKEQLQTELDNLAPND
ncbi:MAG: hypothetical protein FD146_2219 [Anaerolineaceae bacterium]|nr:MAG: hypothetical protein FD146_2219 [Anaerolineaceae bacterium]